MLSFKNQALLRFTDRLSFKKMKEEKEEEEEYADVYMANSPFHNESEFYEYVYMRRHTRKRPVIPFSEYTGTGSPHHFGFKKERKAVVDPYASDYRYNGTFIDHQASIQGGTFIDRYAAMSTPNKMQDKQASSSPKPQFSFFHAIDEAIGQMKQNRANNKLNNRKNNRFPGAGKVNADVKIQFYEDKFVYRV